MKRILVLCLALIMLLTVFSACKKKGGDTTDTTTDPSLLETPETDDGLDEFGRPILESSLPSDLTYNKAEINIAVPALYEIRFAGDGSKAASSVDQTVFKRNGEVEEILDVVIEYHPIGTTMNYDAAIMTTQVMGYLSGNGEMDIVLNRAYDAPALGMQGCYANLNTIDMLDMTHGSWNAVFADAVSYNGALYVNVGDYSVDFLYQIVGTFFNKQLVIDRFGSTDVVYDMVEDGTWTMANLQTMLKDVYSDKNQNGQRDLDDFYGFVFGSTSSPCEAMITNIGFDPTVKNSDDEYEMFEMTTGLSDKLDDIQEFVAALCMDRSLWNWDNGDASFSSQNCMFLYSTLETILQRYTDLDFDYGILPTLKYDENDDYRTAVGDTFQLQSIMRNSKDVERAGAVLQCLNEVSYRTVTPAYFNVVLQYRMANEPRDAEMLVLLRDTVHLDFGRVYSSQISRVTARIWQFVSPNFDYASFYQNTIETWRINIDTLLTALRTQGEE